MLYIHVHTRAYVYVAMYKHGYVPTRLCAHTVMCRLTLCGYVWACRGYVPTRLCPWLCPCSHVLWLCLYVCMAMSMCGYVSTCTCAHTVMVMCGYVHGHGYVHVQTYYVCVRGYVCMCAWSCPYALSRGYTRAKHVWVCPCAVMCAHTGMVMSMCGYGCSHGYGYVCLCLLCYVMLCLLCYVMLCLLCTHPPAVTIVYTSINILSSLYLRQHKNNLAR